MLRLKFRRFVYKTFNDMAAVVANNISIIITGLSVKSKPLLLFYRFLRAIIILLFEESFFIFKKKIIIKNRYCIFYLPVTNYFKHQLLWVIIIFENFIGVVFNSFCCIQNKHRPRVMLK